MSDGREGGYIKLHRRVLSSALWRSMTAEQRGVFVEILFLANWKPLQARWKDRWYEVQRGELSHSLKSIAESANTSIKVVRSTLKALMSDDRPAGGNGPAITEKYPILGTGPGTGPRVLIVVNYCKYQDVPEEAGTALGIDRARVGHGSGTGGAQSKEEEEGEEGKKEACSLLPSEPPRPGFKAVQATLVEAFLNHRKKKYLWQGAKDTDALKRLLATDSLPEILARWKRGLGTENKYLSVATIAQLAAKWNDLAPKVTDNDRQLSGLREAADAEAFGSGRSGNAIGPTRQGPSGIGKTTTTNGSLPPVGASLPPALGALLDDRGKTGDLQDAIALELGAQPGRAKTTGSVCESRADTQ